ncbi:threonine aldolase family protein [Sanguibacter suaedae]|uniref:Threonine aldolase n=1 Tax=Sanguibacter suaedae TaxID=2795737 RepID=A0A934I6C5_9MICO|nr:beta-eliminating lyase-related protein [Sanguibacter suaedae]MBI9114017.1 threonine aldolase [Sanguibacter suaedae]
MQHSFASDNYAGTHPEVLAALVEANTGHARAYGADPWTARLQDVVRGHFGDQATAYPVFNGTGANVVALTSMLPRWGAVVTSRHAHIHNDENAAPERVGGLKLLPVDAPDGKLTVDAVDEEAWGWGDQHRAQPLAVSLTQSTELGTVYTPDEIAVLTEHAHAAGMRVHMDGARVANAAAALGLPLRALTTDVGVDVLSLGGTKNGLLFGEAVVVLDPAAVDGVDYVRKMTMQLTSKMRFVSAQLLAVLDGDLWSRSAGHANAMAARLRRGLEELVTDGRAPGLALTQPTQANVVFATVPAGAADRLREHAAFYDWDAPRREVRWMCSFDTTEEHVDDFVAAVGRELDPSR